jgi:hypothetical protein
MTPTLRNLTAVLSTLSGNSAASYTKAAICDGFDRGVKKRCRLSFLTNSALVYEPKCGGSGGVAESQPMSTAVHNAHGAQINFVDLTPYLTYDFAARRTTRRAFINTKCYKVRFKKK